MNSYNRLIITVLVAMVAITGIFVIYPQTKNRSIINQHEEIDHVLDDVLRNLPGAIIARLGIIHSTSRAVDQTPFYRWDVIHARAAPFWDRGPGPLVHDQPLTLWHDFINELIHHRCVYKFVSDLTESGSREHLSSIGIFASIDCPIIDPNDKFLGTLFVSWPESSAPKTAPIDLFPAVQEASAKIVKILAP